MHDVRRRFLSFFHVSLLNFYSQFNHSVWLHHPKFLKRSGDDGMVRATKDCSRRTQTERTKEKNSTENQAKKRTIVHRAWSRVHDQRYRWTFCFVPNGERASQANSPRSDQNLHISEKNPSRRKAEAENLRIATHVTFTRLSEMWG